jgi:hypothetical protein
VTAGVDIRTGNITSITELRPFTASSNFSSTSANVTGNPLNGRAYNGIAFDLTNPDQFVLARQNATNLQLPASVYQAALKTPTGFFGSFQNATLSTLADEVYVSLFFHTNGVQIAVLKLRLRHYILHLWQRRYISFPIMSQSTSR